MILNFVSLNFVGQILVRLFGACTRVWPDPHVGTRPHVYPPLSWSCICPKLGGREGGYYRKFVGSPFKQFLELHAAHGYHLIVPVWHTVSFYYYIIIIIKHNSIIQLSDYTPQMLFSVLQVQVSKWHLKLV